MVKDWEEGPYQIDAVQDYWREGKYQQLFIGTSEMSAKEVTKPEQLR